MQRSVILGALLLAAIGGTLTMAAGPMTRLLINERPASTAVKMIDGRYYVPLDDLAKALGATTTITLKPEEGTVVALTFKEPGKPEVGAGATVTGVITYYFNANDGSKPDTGARILLARGEFKIPKSGALLPEAIETYKDGSNERIRVKLDLVGKATADGSGRYEIKDVPAGKYTLVVESKHRTDTNLRDTTGQVVCIPVVVEGGKTKDVSWDFNLRNVQ